MTATLPQGNTYTVEMAFPASATFGTSFILDHATRGKLDDATYTLGGDTWADITDRVTSVQISRGRSRQLDQFNAGVCTIVARNDDRELDPSNTAGTYFGGLLPRRPVRIKANSETLFAGYVDDINLGYDTADAGSATFMCVDAFSLLAQASLNAHTPSAQASDARVTAVLDRAEVDFPTARSIGTGSSTLGAFAVSEGTNALQYLQQVNRSEQGYLFAARDGVFTFRGRGSVLNVTPAITIYDASANGTPYYSDLAVQYGTELLYNRIDTQRSGGSVQTATDTASQDAYLTRTLAMLDLLVSTDNAAADIGTFLLGKFAEPELRVEFVTVVIRDATSAYSELMTLELGDVVSVVRNWSQGTPTSETTAVTVERIAHSITPERHIVTVGFGSVDNRAFLELDDATFGRLDNNLLSF